MPERSSLTSDKNEENILRGGLRSTNCSPFVMDFLKIRKPFLNLIISVQNTPRKLHSGA